MIRNLFAIVVATGLVAACEGDPLSSFNEARTGGDPGRAGTLMQKHGCVTCHTIPGVTAGHGLVGPPLGGVGRRQYLAGMLPNTPENMIRWIQNPQAVNPATAMPNMGVSEQEARDIAAYLYSLR